jgi:hypothetical protein
MTWRVPAWSSASQVALACACRFRASGPPAQPRKGPQGPVRDRISAPADRATPREVGQCHTETTRSIPLGSTSASRHSRGTSALFGSALLGVPRSGTRQGPVARGSVDDRVRVAREQRSERASQRRSGSPVNPWTSWTNGSGGASLTTPQAPRRWPARALRASGRARRGLEPLRNHPGRLSLKARRGHPAPAPRPLP